MHVQQEQLPGTRHTFTENAATKVFAIVKLVFANASRVTQALAVVAPLVRKTAMATEFAAPFLKVAVLSRTVRTQPPTQHGMAKKRSCVFAIPVGAGQLAACGAVQKVLTLWHTITK